MGLGLHLVTVEITGRCNLSCRHCYRGNDAHEDLIDFNLLLNQLAEITPYYITVSGGEPLLLEDVFYLAKGLKNVCQKLLLTTNGTLVREFPWDYFRIFDDVQISLDGDRVTHEAIRGKGAFEKAMDAAHYLIGTVPVSMQCTVNQSNYNQLSSIVQISKAMGAVPKMGRMCGFGRNGLDPVCDPNLWKDLLQSAIGCGMLNDDPLSFWFDDKKKKSCKPDKITGGCTAGIAGIAISPDLNVYPCVKLRVPAGNLKKQSLKEIWLKSPLFNELRDWRNLKGHCSTCEFVGICRGCRADAWARTGDYLTADPLCWLDGDS
jgi:radical SAM protein with 4Fe4S-binding SPASM domain